MRGGFGDEGLQDGVDDGVVPGGGAVVLVGCCGGEGGGAGVCGDLGEAGCVDGLWVWLLVIGVLFGGWMGRAYEGGDGGHCCGFGFGWFG